MTPRIVPAGDAALCVEYDDRIDLDLNAQVIALATRLQEARVPGVRDIVPAFRTLTVYFDLTLNDVASVTNAVRLALAAASSSTTRSGATLDVPVCYDAEFGPDLDAVAARSGFDRATTIRLHSEPEYRVFMLGFTPGFAYMGIVDDRIAAPRLATPRTHVPAGSVGIAGAQTGVYPSDTPGGWNLIGRTPLRCWTPDADRPTLFEAGDRVRFRAIDRTEFDALFTAGARTS